MAAAALGVDLIEASRPARWGCRCGLGCTSVMSSGQLGETQFTFDL
jgi:hypothetical protein